MIINIRGTSGSGKTYTARSFMNHCGQDVPIYDENGKVAAHVAYYNMVPVFFIGSYSNVCGGCDTVRTQDMACSLVRHFSQFGHVIFEGLIISHSFARYASLWEELADEYSPFIFAYMDTPLELCIERVEQRRLEKGNTKPFNPKNTTNHFYSTLGTKDKFDDVGIDTIMINHLKDPVRQITRLLKLENLDFSNSYKEEKF